MMEIDRLSAGEAIVCSDVGQHQMWAAQLIRFNAPRLWINSGGLGAMGFGLPSAIGAQFARPDKLVFALVGDGGFQMSIPELSTIASHGLPIKIIVMNNGYLGMVRQWQELFYNNRLSSVELDCFPDAEKLAAAYGFKGRTIDKPWELGAGPRRGGSRTRALPAQRQGIALRKRLSHGARRRRHQRNGAGAAPARRGAQVDRRPGSLMLQIISLTSGKQARRSDAHHRLTKRARLQHREPNRRPHAGSRTLPYDHRGRRGRRRLRQQVIKQMNKLVNVLQAVDLTESPAVRREMVLVRVRTAHRNPHRRPERSRDLRRPRSGFLHRRLCPRSHRRSRKTGRVHRRHAQLWRDRSHPLGRRGRLAGSQEIEVAAPRADK